MNVPLLLIGSEVYTTNHRVFQMASDLLLTDAELPVLQKYEIRGVELAEIVGTVHVEN